MEAAIWILAILAIMTIPFLSVYGIRRWKQVRFNRKWNLPDAPAENTDSAEILGKTGVQTAMGDIWHRQ